MTDFNTVATWLSDEGALGSCLGGIFHEEEDLDAAVVKLVEAGVLKTDIACQILLYAYAFSGSQYTLRCLRESFVRTGLLNKQVLLGLYLAQSKDARLAVSPFLNLDDLMCSCGDYKAVTSDTHFTKPEILAIAEQVRDIHVNDLRLLVGKSGFFKPDVLSIDFLEHQLAHQDQLDGVMTSFLLWGMYIKDSKSVDLKRALAIGTAIAQRSPDSHGVHRCLQLIIQIALDGGDEDSGVEAATQLVLETYRVKKSAISILFLVLENCPVGMRTKISAKLKKGFRDISVQEFIYATRLAKGLMQNT